MLTRRSIIPGLVAGMAAGTGLLASGLAQPSGQAPEFDGIDRWLNADARLSIAGLRGKVVLVDFWTYSCINCRRTVPYLNRWQAEYSRAGLQVVGIHTPEFGFERAHRNVDAAVRDFGIRYPVGQDNHFETWRAWHNQAWPAFYLVDQTGRIVLVREGEGHAAELEAAIRTLLGLEGSPTRHPGDDPDLSRIRSPEMYFGAAHPTPQDRAQSPRDGEAAYSFARLTPPRLNAYQLDGRWIREAEALVLQSGRGSFRTTVSAAKVHLVAEAPQPAGLRISIDGGASARVEIARPNLYTLLDGQSYGEHTLAFEAEAPGLTLYSATFG